MNVFHRMARTWQGRLSLMIAALTLMIWPEAVAYAFGAYLVWVVTGAGHCPHHDTEEKLKAIREKYPLT